jgi:hypothetical protein
MDVIEGSREERRTQRPQRALEKTVLGAEQAALTVGTSGVYRFRAGHPWLYGIIAFFLGGAVVSAFIISGYSNWVYEGINLKVALYKLVVGGVAGGIVGIILAFAVTRVFRTTLPALRSAGVIKR